MQWVLQTGAARGRLIPGGVSFQEKPTEYAVAVLQTDRVGGGCLLTCEGSVDPDDAPCTLCG